MKNPISNKRYVTYNQYVDFLDKLAHSTTGFILFEDTHISYTDYGLGWWNKDTKRYNHFYVKG